VEVHNEMDGRRQAKFLALQVERVRWICPVEVVFRAPEPAEIEQHEYDRYIETSPNI